MHNAQQFLNMFVMIQPCDLLEQLQYMQNTCPCTIGEKIITPYVLTGVVAFLQDLENSMTAML